MNRALVLAAACVWLWACPTRRCGVDYMDDYTKSPPTVIIPPPLLQEAFQSFADPEPWLQQCATFCERDGGTSWADSRRECQCRPVLVTPDSCRRYCLTHMRVERAFEPFGACCECDPSRRQGDADCKPGTE